tara:strand:- start:221 stop:655 length:435 start_codon:yes stop_codon:yes gene_type:complete
MKKSEIIKKANLGKAGASVFTKLAIDDLGTLNKEKPKPKVVPKVEPKKVTIPKELPKPVKLKPFNHDSMAVEIAKRDPIFKARLDSQAVAHKTQLDSINAAYKKEWGNIMREDSLRNAANREGFVQDSLNYGGIIARIKRSLGF